MARTPLAQRLQDAFVAAECERQGDCFFAGEHTSVDFQGYLNGAVETGERAAGEIRDDLT